MRSYKDIHLTTGQRVIVVCMFYEHVSQTEVHGFIENSGLTCPSYKADACPAYM